MDNIKSFILLIIIYLSTIDCSHKEIILEGALEIGAIAGCVISERGEPIQNCNIIVNSESNRKIYDGSCTGVDGKYLVIGLNSDYYSVTASATGYQEVTFINVKVVEDSITVVDSDRMWQDEGWTPAVLLWKPSKSNIQHLKRYLQGGSIFDKQCNNK